MSEREARQSAGGSRARCTSAEELNTCPLSLQPLSLFFRSQIWMRRNKQLIEGVKEEIRTFKQLKRHSFDGRKTLGQSVDWYSSIYIVGLVSLGFGGLNIRKNSKRRSQPRNLHTSSLLKVALETHFDAQYNCLQKEAGFQCCPYVHCPRHHQPIKPKEKQSKTKKQNEKSTRPQKCEDWCVNAEMHASVN